jgi:hypothetical protein
MFESAAAGEFWTSYYFLLFEFVSDLSDFWDEHLAVA